MNSALAKIAARQAGVFSRQQALAARYSDNQISRAIKSGAWTLSSSGVYRLAGTPMTLTTRGWLAVLAAGDGALLSHRVAGYELLELARRAGLNPQPQFTVTENGRFVARVDLAVPGLKLALEADGYATHARRPGFERDRERLSLLQAAGWTVLAFTAAQIRDRPQWVIDVIRRTVGRLAA